jgi:O-antigen/teichoic acid export membrane protein
MELGNSAANLRRGGALAVFLARLEIDQAVAFGMLTRGWRAAAGIVSVLLISRFFSPEVQGFYYTFASVLALQSFVELGFYIVIVNVASHEWADLKLDNAGRIVGESRALSRLVSMGRFVFKWYAAASVIFVIAVGIVGHIFFSQSLHTDVHWQWPWLFLVMLSGMVLWTLPFMSLLEGCDQVGPVNKFRMMQAILVSAVFWIAVITGANLWATVVSTTVSLACATYFLLVRYRFFFEPFFNAPTSARIEWRTELWPMQWRLAAQGLVGYLAHSLFNPVIFHYHGAVAAGQMGMTLQLATMLRLLAMSWLQAKIPRFGILIAQKDYQALDRLWLRVSLISLLFISTGAGAAWVLVYGLNVAGLALAQRLLGPLPTGLILAAIVISQIVQCEAAYLRAHKREPFVVSGIVTAVTMGVLVWLLGMNFGAFGASVAYLLVTSVIALPFGTFIWFRRRAEWRS